MKKRNMIYAFLLALMAFVVSCKKDTEVNKDTFKIENEKVTATTQSVMITGSYAYSGAIDVITLELGRQADLMDADAYRTLIEDTDFSVEVKNLRTNTTYYYRYAVEYGGKTPYYTDIKSFKTQEYNLPEVKSVEVVSVGVNRAEVSGEVLSDGGGDAVTLRGVCWSTSHNPSVGDEYANAGEGIGTFTCELTNLQSEKTYYARAFAGNSKGVSYGEELTFVTMAAGSLAEVKTVGISGNANLQATVNGDVTNEGTSAVLERGVCYGKEHYPTTSGLHVSAGTGAGAFSCQLVNLDANATYFVRAYAINSLGIAYGEEMSFVAQSEMTAPVVLTGMVSDITVSSATGHGTVVSDGGATVTLRGLCWSTEHNPTVADTHADCGNGVGEFSGMMPRLTDLTTYYVRAYAENAVGMAYGEEVSFTVGDHFQPVLPSIGQFTINGTIVTYAIINDGGAEVIEHGVCWNTTHNPTVSGSHVSGGSGTGDFSIELTDLLPGTTYYARIYAINRVGVAYSDEVNFNTFQAVTTPTVATSEVTNITQTTATGGGNVTDDGNATVIHRGICWSTSHNPTTSGSHASSGTGMGSFTVEMTGLTPSTTYYVRAYAQNSAGIAYGDELSFTTEATAPGDTFSENLDDGMPAGWTTIDADGDGYIWVSSMNPGDYHNSGVDLTGTGHNASAAYVISGSYANGTGQVLHPDNYLVSPQMNIVNGSTFSFWACAQDAGYPADHFGVAISDNGTSNWTMVNEWTMTAKSGGNVTNYGRGGDTRAQGNWYQYSVDLSAFAGQKYIAIRHFNCSDQFILNVDDIELSNAKK